MKSKRSKACDIPQKVKKIVWERDRGRCVLCHRNEYQAFLVKPNAHYIPRSKGGLGVERNVVTLCAQCHEDTDHSAKREENLAKIRAYLVSCYPDWDEGDLRFKKYGN